MRQERLLAELAFHDQQAHQRWQTHSDHAAWLRFQPQEYLTHESWIQPAIELMGDVQGRSVLDYGCGHGMAGVVLAGRGARVTAFDLSGGYVHECIERAMANNVAAQVQAVQAAGERLPFADHSFDRVWGHAILHHLDLQDAAPEIRRVIKPGGWGVFCEPWGGNPLFEWGRLWLHYPGKHRSKDEQPLHWSDLVHLHKSFPRMQVFPYQLLGSLRRLKSGLPGLGWLDRIDHFLMHHCNGLRRFCRYAVLLLPRD